MPPAALTTGRRNYTAIFFVAAVVLALIVRLPGLFMSLWYDELYTLLHFINAPLLSVVRGEYSPNNHVLFTLIAKVFAAGADGSLSALMTRLPSVLAGVGVAALLARPLMKTQSRAAILILIIVAVHPWAVVISNWVRGYSLLLLLVVWATDLLSQRRIGWLYVALLAAAMYTVPLALLLVAAHGLTLLLPAYRGLRRRWLVCAGVAVAGSVVLYLPFADGIRSYWGHAGGASVGYGEFLAGSFRHAYAGQNLQQAWCTVAGVVVCAGGAALAWRRWPELRPVLLSFAAVSALGLLAPLVIRSAGEVRAMIWLIPLFCLGLAAMLETLWARPRLRVGAALVALLALAGLLRLDLILWETPAQPIGSALKVARALAGHQGAVVGVYMAAPEAAAAYQGMDAVAMDESQLERVEAVAPRPLVAVVFYESYLRRDEPALWAHLERDYEPVQRLEGIISPAEIYRHK